MKRLNNFNHLNPRFFIKDYKTGIEELKKFGPPFMLLRVIKNWHETNVDLGLNGFVLLGTGVKVLVNHFSGKSPQQLTLGLLEKHGISADTHKGIPSDSSFSVIVPGAAAGWVDTVERFGSGKVR